MNLTIEEDQEAPTSVSRPLLSPPQTAHPTEPVEQTSPSSRSPSLRSPNLKLFALRQRQILRRWTRRKRRRGSVSSENSSKNTALSSTEPTWLYGDHIVSTADRIDMQPPNEIGLALCWVQGRAWYFSEISQFNYLHWRFVNSSINDKCRHWLIYNIGFVEYQSLLL